MVLVPGNNPFDVEVRAEERAAERERLNRAGAGAGGGRNRPLEEAASAASAEGRPSLAQRIRRWLRIG